ncbi:hypothetical protein RBH26_06955 [Natronolimnohabitans sp. A-GB9]|uniref:hypothetical protein n=1 Tax=Natronolimnohabitans sp. A-GB9 TaxID=3069757 RepID=UPI0027B06AC5|nr:hypothetical protein [Natronolimnohabitans sp. A-GB9]MDQ2050220.1 hypothetical protein [Natronolimnohabitans sp. A-GB9]
MSGGKGSDNELNRRTILRRTAAGTVGTGSALSALLGTVSAEKTTREDLDRIEDAPGVQEILTELGVHRLPGPGRAEKRRIEDDGCLTEGELVTWKIEIRPYGILHAFEYEERIGAVFTFGPDTAKTPAGYSMAAEANASLGTSGSDLVFSRNATDAETEHVLSVIDVDGDIDSARVHATTAADGFRATVQVASEETDELDTREYVVSVGADFDPRSESLSDVLTVEDDAADILIPEPLTRTAAISFPDPKDIALEVIKTWLVDNVVTESLEFLGRECDSCGDCANVIIDVLGGCSLCRPLMGTGASGVGAILFVTCYYAWCGKVSDKVECAACFACLLTNEDPDIPDEADALAWVWDELPSPPSRPSIL